MAIPTNGTSVDILARSRSESGSPPIEIVSVNGEEDADFEDDDSITMLDESGRSLAYDPTISFPFHDATESYLETVLRLLQYLPTRKFTLDNPLGL
jgi:ubiquitin carboxyl-terminal hydrolase 34